MTGHPCGLGCHRPGRHDSRWAATRKAVEAELQVLDLGLKWSSAAMNLNFKSRLWNHESRETLCQLGEGTAQMDPPPQQAHSLEGRKMAPQPIGRSSPGQGALLCQGNLPALGFSSHSATRPGALVVGLGCSPDSRLCLEC